MTLAILLAFSRAAWGGLVITSAFMLALMVLTSPSQRAALAHHRHDARRRHHRGDADRRAAVVRFHRADVQAARQLRPELRQGRFGRFGRHILGAEMALDLPFGIGPLQFNRYFPEDTHNSYLNAFMSGGWLAGVCYPALVFVTVDHGLPLRLRPRALAARLSRDLRRVPRHRRRKLHHRHRPLAALLDDAGRDVGHVRRRAALAGERRSGAQPRAGFRALSALAFGAVDRSLRAPSSRRQASSCSPAS